nr:helix-turn-helix domain-containing protein [Enterococcus faecalis]
MSKKTQKKLAVFLYLAKQTNLNLSSVAKTFDLSNKNLSIYLHEIQEDLAEINESTLKIQINHGKISLHTSENDFLSHYFLLFNYYCLNSTDFILFQAIIKKENNSVWKVSQETNFSSSYIYKRLNNINKLLALYGISVHFSPSASKVIKGTEFQVIYAFLDVYWTIFLNTLALPKYTSTYFEDILTQHIKPEILERLEFASRLKLNLLLHIAKYRFPYTCEVELQKEFEKHPYLSLYSEPTQTIFCCQSDFSKTQKEVINIIAPIAIDNFDSAKQAEYLLASLIEISCPEYYYVDALLTDFCQVFQISEMREVDRHYFLLILFKNVVYNQLFISKQPNTAILDFLVNKNSASQKTLQKEIYDFYQSFSGNFPYQLEFKDQENPNWICELLLRIYKHYSPRTKIKIGVSYSRDFYIASFIMMKIKQAFSEDIIFERTNFSTCDIVITDYPMFNLPKKIERIYILEEELTREDWELIFSKISIAIFDLQ